MNNKTNRIEEQYINSKYEGKTMQVIRFKNDPVEDNNVYYRIPTIFDPSPKWNYIAYWELDKQLKKEGWEKDHCNF